MSRSFRRSGRRHQKLFAGGDVVYSDRDLGDVALLTSTPSRGKRKGIGGRGGLDDLLLREKLKIWNSQDIGLFVPRDPQTKENDTFDISVCASKIGIRTNCDDTRCFPKSFIAYMIMIIISNEYHEVV